ncbi:hypothetical protein FGG79_03405 [Bacillus sp. BHET2]|nr:hypothetical protein FGG79_03405 [Bacillus sp. BHET2]
MKTLYKNIILFITVLIIFMLFDYVKHDELIMWKENTIQALFFILFYSLLVWLINGKKRK